MSQLEETLAWHLKAAGIDGWEREYRFARHIGRRWRFDFAFVSCKLAVEVDGGTWSGGRHVRPGGFVKDAEKKNAATLLGWRVLHVVGRQVEDGTALVLIEQALAWEAS